METSEVQHHPLKLSRRTLLQIGARAVLASPVAALLAACGGGSSPSAPATTGATSTTAATGATTAQTPTSGTTGAPASPAASPSSSASSAGASPAAAGMVPDNVKPGGTLTVALGTDISSMEPQQTTETSSDGVRLNLYDSLVWIDNPKWQVIPWLASKWEVSDDGKTYQFTLTDTPVKFHDGTSFSADAVKATFDRLLGPNKSTAAGIDFAGILDTVTVVDPKTVKFTLSAPFAPFLIRMGYNAAAILSPDAITKYGQNYSDHPIGTGPYKFVEYRKGDHVTFVKNPDYWNGTVYYDQVIYKIVPEDASRATLVQTGEAQVADRIPPALASALQGGGNAIIRADHTSRFVFMEFNQHHDLMKDARVRQALNYGVDKDSIVKNIMKGYGGVPTAPIPTVAQYAQAQTPYTYDVAKAKSLLQEAGVKAGTPLVIWSPQGRYVGDKDIATAVQGMMNDLGFNASVQVFGDFPTYIKQLDSLNYDMAIWGWVSPDPDVGLNNVYSGQFAGKFPNWGGYSNPTVDGLLKQAVASTTDAERANLYAQAQKQIWQDAPVLWLDWQQNLTGLSTKVVNVYDDLEEVLVVRFSGYKA
ncbi:MAG TPA: ABC transporter substrate-binding protein [Thermomicrobiaceae bacterium]|nr:ABC transporter substrate-binding protein [Thermomicrobiaceae bacterium]